MPVEPIPLDESESSPDPKESNCSAMSQRKWASPTDTQGRRWKPGIVTVLRQDDRTWCRGGRLFVAGGAVHLKQSTDERQIGILCLACRRNRTGPLFDGAQRGRGLMVVHHRATFANLFDNGT